ncbi:MAG: hypothetical protein ACE5F9_01630 [Phycisphaerae bacterium]
MSDAATPSGTGDQSETGAAGVPDRRKKGQNRRVEPIVDRRSGLERRRGPGRRRADARRSAEEGELTDEQFEFVLAMDDYKRKNKRPFPSWTEVLEVIKYLGYRRIAEVGEHIDRPAPDKPT